MSRHPIVGIGLCAWFAVAGAAAAPDAPPPVGVAAPTTAATTAVRKLLAEQQADWNRGDIDAFMKGYWKDPSIRFAGGDSYRYGWDATIARYRKTYPDTTIMGKLDFDLLEVRELSSSVVYVFGKWHLTRVNEDPEAVPHGLFTLIVEKKGERWVVTRDHTSSAND